MKLQTYLFSTKNHRPKFWANQLIQFLQVVLKMCVFNQLLSALATWLRHLVIHLQCWKWLANAISSCRSNQKKRERVGNLQEVRYPADSCLPLLVTRWMALRFRFAVFFYSYENHCGHSLWSQPAFLLKQEEVPIVIYLLGWLQLTCASAHNTSEAWVWVQSSYFPFFLPKPMEPNKKLQLSQYSFPYLYQTKFQPTYPSFFNTTPILPSWIDKLKNINPESLKLSLIQWSFGKDHCFSRDVYINNSKFTVLVVSMVFDFQGK